jgi:hypothetical protein
MAHRKLARALAPLVLSGFLLACLGGCGSGSSAGKPTLTDRDKLTTALPSGITMETAVRPDPAYGDSSKTVEDALVYVQAYVKDGVVLDAVGHEIRFETGQKPAAKQFGKAKKPITFIYLQK